MGSKRNKKVKPEAENFVDSLSKKENESLLSSDNNVTPLKALNPVKSKKKKSKKGAEAELVKHIKEDEEAQPQEAPVEAARVKKPSKKKAAKVEAIIDNDDITEQISNALAETQETAQAEIQQIQELVETDTTPKKNKVKKPPKNKALGEVEAVQNERQTVEIPAATQMEQNRRQEVQNVMQAPAQDGAAKKAKTKKKKPIDEADYDQNGSSVSGAIPVGESPLKRVKNKRKISDSACLDSIIDSVAKGAGDISARPVLQQVQTFVEPGQQLVKKSKKRKISGSIIDVNGVQNVFANGASTSTNIQHLPEDVKNSSVYGVASLDNKPIDAADSARGGNDINWPEGDLDLLISRMEKCIPEKDTLAYSTRAEKLDWNEIAFGKYSADECKATWNLLQKHIRKFRLLHEVLVDAKEYVKNPPKKSKRHPDLPRRPQSSYMLFYLNKKDEILAEHPGIDAQELAKRASALFKLLPQEIKDRYERQAAILRVEYESKMQDFYEIHPELKPKTPEKVPKVKADKPLRPPKPPKPARPPKPPKPVKVVLRAPKKPQTPFVCYFKNELKKQEDITDADKRSEFRDLCKQHWKGMADEEKIFWVNMSEKSLQDYETSTKMYMQEHPEFVPRNYKHVITKDDKLLKERLAGKPLRPPNSAYSLFTKKVLLSGELKSIDPKERMNLISVKWKALSEEDKKVFQDEIVRLNDDYKAAYNQYLASLPEDKKKEELEKSKGVKRKQSEDAKSDQQPLAKKKRIRAPKKEKKPEVKKFAEPEQPPISAYKYFQKGYSGPEPVSAVWKRMTPAEKKRYEDELMAKKKEYIQLFEKFLKSLTKEELEQYSQARKHAKENAEENDDDDDDSCSSGSDMSDGSDQEDEEDSEN